MSTRSWGSLIRKWRLDSRVSQTDLGSKAGLSRGIIAAIERGDRAIKEEEFIRVCRVLEKDPAVAHREESVSLLQRP